MLDGRNGMSDEYVTFSEKGDCVANIVRLETNGSLRCRIGSQRYSTQARWRLGKNLT